MNLIGKNFLSAFENNGNQQPEKTATDTPKPEDSAKTETTETKDVQEPENPKADEKEKDVQVEQEKNDSQKNDKEVVQKIEAEEKEEKSFEIDDDAVLNYFKEKKGKELESLDDLFKEPEPTENPLEGLSDDVSQFVKYNKETGRGYDEYKALNRDYSKADPVELAREKAIAQSDGFLDRSNVDEYLERKLNIDVSDYENMSPVEKMELKQFSSDYLNKQLELQEKYKQPKSKADQPEMVTLENGQQMQKEVYEKLVNQQKQYQNAVKEASDNIKASNFEIAYDDNGTEKTMNLEYQFNKDEVHDMTSSAIDIDGFYKKAFGTKDGGIDYAELQEGLYYANRKNRVKAISAIVQKALAKQAEEFAELEHNAGVKTKSMPNGKTSKNAIDITDMRKGRQQGSLRFTPDQF